jgi:hypothetical protein
VRTRVARASAALVCQLSESALAWYGGLKKGPLSRTRTSDMSLRIRAAAAMILLGGWAGGFNDHSVSLPMSTERNEQYGVNAYEPAQVNRLYLKLQLSNRSRAIPGSSRRPGSTRQLITATSANGPQRPSA